MGSRANITLAEAGGYRFFYTHWGAQQLPCDLFWGVEHVRRYVLQQREVAPDEWLDDCWAEGGALIDLERGELLLFSWLLHHDIPLRRLYFGLLARSWRGWDARWAARGVFDLACYVGVSPEQVRGTPRWDADEAGSRSLAPARFPWADTAGSVRLPDGSLKLFRPPEPAAWYLFAGPELLELAQEAPGVERLVVGEHPDRNPRSGFHVDGHAREMTWWTADEPRHVESLAAAWPGWRVAPDGRVCLNHLELCATIRLSLVRS